MAIKDCAYRPKEEYEKLYGVKDEDRHYYTTTSTSPIQDEIKHAEAKAAWEKEIEKLKPAAIWTMPLQTVEDYRDIEGWLLVLKELSEQNRKNLMNAMLIYLENNK